VTRLRSVEPRKPAAPVNGTPTRLAGGWKPPRPEQPAAAANEHRPVTLFASGLALLGVAALAIALLASRHEGPQAKLMPLPSAATDLVAGGGRLWAAAPQAGEVWMLDDETGDPAAPALRTGGTPARIAIGDDGAWAADTQHGALVRVRGSRVSAPVAIGPDVSDVAVAGDAVWAASAADGMVRVLPSGARRARAFAVGGHPVALAADERNVVVASADGAVSWFDARTRRSVATIRVGGTPIAAAMDRGAAWIADTSRGTVQRIALEPGGGSAGVVSGRPISVGPGPVAVAARDGLVYVVCRDRTLAVVDEDKGVVKRSVALGVDPAAVAVDGEHVWVAAAGRSALARIDRRRLS
jgi:DNA-binding beta-propeller fold protein YncE